MQAQNERVDRWMTHKAFTGSIEDLERAMEGLIMDTYEATEQTVGGVWIMRAMRAVPALQQVRLASHTTVTKEQTKLLAMAFPDVNPAELQLVSRIVVELVYATVELIFDEPLDVGTVAHTVAGMIASHLRRIRPNS